MFSISVIKCFVIIIIVFSCLSSIASNSIIQTNAIHSDNSIKPLISSSSNSHSIHSFGANNDNRQVSGITSQTVDKASCNTRANCPEHSYCEAVTHRCKCNGDYVSVHNFMNATKSLAGSLICLPVAKLDDKCDSHEQCLVSNSMCMWYPVSGVGGYNKYHCKCREGYHSEDKEEVIYLEDNQKLTNRPICGEFSSIGNSWIGTFAIVCIMLVIILIGCFVGILRFQRWKQRPLASTVTGLAAQGHTQHMMSSSPPPMGSVEAEFQNDFIQVFPMHHLEPLPDKNTAHEYVIK